MTQRQITYTRHGIPSDSTEFASPATPVFIPKPLTKNPEQTAEDPYYTTGDVERDSKWFMRQRSRLESEGRGPVLAIRHLEIVTEAPSLNELEERLGTTGRSLGDVFVAKLAVPE